MLRTGIPLAWATSEWASSCASTEAKRSSEAKIPAAQYVLVVLSGEAVGKKPKARVVAKNINIRIHE